MRLTLSPSSLDSYRLFLRIKALPAYRFEGRTAVFPDEYKSLVLGDGPAAVHSGDYVPLRGLFDYQRDITALAVRKRKFAAFVEPGYGKTLCETEFARHAVAHLPPNRCALIVTPLMVVPQFVEEIGKFYGPDLAVDVLPARDLNKWLAGGTGRIGLTNWEALRDETQPGRLGCLVLDESSFLKSMYGKWGQTALRLGAGLEWKLCGTGTPAPNDRIEFANHAVFLDHFPTVNSFLARFFVNRGQTGERWELKPHALRPFYRALSHWCLFLSNPATYGWQDNAGTLPPIHVHYHNVDLSAEQRGIVQNLTGGLFGTVVGGAGGITKRSTFGQIAKGRHRGKDVDTLKPAAVAALCRSWPDESTLVWCKYNAEQDTLERAMPEAASMRGDTPHDKRQAMLADFKAGKVRTLITKPEILGFGLNLQVATRQVFSTLQDSYEEFFQAVKRSNRVGSTRPLNVHVPLTELERPMVENVMRKAARVQADTEEQERLFKEVGYGVH